MNDNLFTNWCQTATEKIRYGPDRKAVAAELIAHLEDHRDTLMAQGLSKKEAERKAVTAMGSAKEIAPQLAAIHKPWLGYLYSLVRCAAVITATFAIFYAVTSVWNLAFTVIGANQFDSLPKNFGTLDHYDHPNVSDHSDCRYYQVTEAGYSKNDNKFYFEMRVIYWPQLRNNHGLADFWAVDSLGNYYASRLKAGYEDIPHVGWSGASISGCIAHYNMVITHFDTNAQWVELHYDQDGRDIVLRIDLTGGHKNGTT